MKKYSLLLIFIISSTYNFYAQPAIQWQKCLGGANSDVANSINQTIDKGYIIAGTSFSNDSNVTGHHGTNSYSDYWIVKLDSFGNLQWQKSLGGIYNEVAKSIQQTSDSGYIVAGYSNSNDGDVSGHHGTSFYYDYWIVKLDNTGNLQWQKSLGGSGNEAAYSIKQTTDGGYVVGGFNNSFDGDVSGNHNGADYWIVKLDDLGTIEWQKSLGGTNNDFATSIQQTTEGGYIIAGNSNSNDSDVSGNHGGRDYWIAKLNETGSIEWEKSLGGMGGDFATSIQQTIDGGYILAGYSSSNDADVSGHHGTLNQYDYWIVKLDCIGIIEWQKSLGGTDDDHAYSVKKNIDGGSIVIGSSRSNNGNVTGHHGLDDYWVVKLNDIGDVEWQKSLGGVDIEQAYSIQQTTDEGYILVGYSNSNDGDVSGNLGDSDFWIVKLSSTVNVNEISKSIIDFQISPNPFSNETVLSFKLSASKNVSLIIYDLEGRIIKNITSKNLNIGDNKILWDSTNNTGRKVDDGVYFITVVSDNIILSKKVMVLKN